MSAPPPRLYRGKSLAERRDDQRGRLISAARDVFARRGFTAAGIDEIVAEARVSRSSFYSFFANKEQCLLEVFEEGRRRVTAALASVIAQDLEPVERIRAEITVLAESFAADPAMARVLLIEAVGATPEVERARAAARQAAADVIEMQLRDYPAWRERPEERAVVALTTMAAIAESLSHLIATDRIDEWPAVVGPVTDYVARGLNAKRS
ncbi:MAG: TetR/AcrR family transcriptional regulator [Solirubrobacteraceae bacterium]